MKVIGYTRVSTEEQAATGVSLQAQAEKVRAYASLYDLEIVEIIEDAGQSAKSLKRPGIQRALEMLRTGEAQGLLVANLDRLTRSLVDLNMLISDYFSEKGKVQASLFSVADQVDARSAGGRLVLNVLMSVSQWEREKIGERSRTAMAYKKSQGQRLGAPSLGVRVENGQAVEDHEEIKTARYILSLREQGLTLQDISDKLNAEGRRTKRGAKWYPKTVDNVIRRQVA